MASVERLVLEIASGTGEHAVYFARAVSRPRLAAERHPPDALASIAAWRAEAGLPNVRAPLVIDAASSDWPIEHADAVLSINMVHISPWTSALGLLAGAARLSLAGAPLILYGPWLKDDMPRRRQQSRLSTRISSAGIQNGACGESGICRGSARNGA